MKLEVMFNDVVAATERISRDVICEVTQVDEDEDGDDIDDELTME